MVNFLYWVFGVGILIALCQDLKRREVDNWLNLLLFVVGSVFVIFQAPEINLLSLILVFFIIFLSAILVFSEPEGFEFKSKKVKSFFKKFNSEIFKKTTIGLTWSDLFVFFFFGLVASLVYSFSRYDQLLVLVFTISIFFILMVLFYLGRFFGGGDAKLLFAMAPLFVSLSILDSMISAGVFIFLLMISGAIYGLTYSIVIGIKHFKGVKKIIPEEAKKLRLNYWLIIGLTLILLGFLSYYLIVFGILILVFALLFVFAKSLERAAMYRKIKTSLLREGDWLVDDVKIGKKVIRADFNGLSVKDIKFIQKHKKEVLIKGGLPFLPAFVIAFALYLVWKDFFLFLISLF